MFYRERMENTISEHWIYRPCWNTHTIIRLLLDTYARTIDIINHSTKVVILES